MRGAFCGTLCALAGALALPVGLAGQEAVALFEPWTDRASPTLAPQAAPVPRTAVPTLLSLALPGAGQHVLGQRRKWAYLALEVLGWAVVLERRGAGSDLRSEYRNFAWDQGRIQSGPRIDGDFEYYEMLTKWLRSGAFDRDGSLPGVQPELDQATHNGSIWALASQIFLPGGMAVPMSDPAYQAALAYYVDRAYGTELLWDWSRAPGAQQQLAELIESSDDRFRQATTALGVVIANHVLSAGDAYLSARGRGAPVQIRVEPGPGFARAGWYAVLRVPLTR